MKFLLGVFAVGALIGVTMLGKKKRDERIAAEEAEAVPAYNGAGAQPGDPVAHTPQVTHG